MRQYAKFWSKNKNLLSFHYYRAGSDFVSSSFSSHAYLVCITVRSFKKVDIFFVWYVLVLIPQLYITFGTVIA